MYPLDLSILMERKGLSTTMGRQRTVDRQHNRDRNSMVLKEGRGRTFSCIFQ